MSDMLPDVRHARDQVHTLVDMGIDLEGAVHDLELRPTTREERRLIVPDAVDSTTRSVGAHRRRIVPQRADVERRAHDIDTSLAAAVAVAVELALDSIHAPADADEVDALVDELGHLRDALDDLRSDT